MRRSTLQEHTVSWGPLRSVYLENLGHGLIPEEAMKDGQDLSWAERRTSLLEMEEGRGEPRVASAQPERLLSQLTVPLSPAHLPPLQPRQGLGSLCPRVGGHDSSGPGLLRWAPCPIPLSQDHQHHGLWPGSRPHGRGARTTPSCTTNTSQR